MVIAGDFPENGSFLTDDSLKHLDLSHLSITWNGLSIEEEAIENLLGVLPYHFEPEWDSDGPEKHSGGVSYPLAI